MLPIDIVKEFLLVCTSISATIIVTVAASFVLSGFKSIFTKFGISVDNDTMNGIINIVSQVIKYLDQKFVDTIKKNSSNGSLTEYQKELIKSKCVSMIKSILNSEQVAFLLKKYNMENVDDVLDILIESNIKDTRTNNSETIVVNDSNDIEYDIDEDMGEIATIYKPTEKEMASISLCPGDCTLCTLSNECSISRNRDYKEIK